jgi:hypothetical protein
MTFQNQIYCVSLPQIFDITYEERWRDRPCETLATCRLLREGEGAKSDSSAVAEGKDKLQVVFSYFPYFIVCKE